MNESRVTFFVKVRAKAGSEDRLAAALASLVPLTREESGCMEYVLHVSKADRSELVIYESWRSQGDLDRHLQMPYVQSFMTSAADMIDGEPVPWMLEEIACATHPG